jgi:aminoglycoside/choline kinase family phosphotransferase
MMEQEAAMENCTCGVERRRFWLWRDANGALHASRFPPSNGAVRNVFASTAHDALLSQDGVRPPKHNVNDADDGLLLKDGRCAAAG